MCRRTRFLTPAEREAEMKAIQQRLEYRYEVYTHPPKNQPEFCFEEVWIEQVPFFLHHSNKVHPLFTPDLCENDLSLYEEEERFREAYRLAAKDFAQMIIMPHEDCPLLWPKPKWVFYLRKIFLQALRHFPYAPLSVPYSSSDSYSTASSLGQSRPQAPRSQPRWPGLQ